ncbi:hypothetical protein BJ165DRAFT_1183623 [Panaeolus papilionaceus]|nr:hypothetical protein BJ165DRAFT_1183623 [Panaeolus papilionaceus]
MLKNSFCALTMISINPERQPLLKPTAWHYTSTPTYNWNKLFRSSVVVILLLVFGSFLDGVYYEQKYSLLARRWAAEERRHVSQRATWDDERKVYERNKEIWSREAQEHQADREKWAQEKAAEQRRLDAISWKPLTPGDMCLRYNTREYTSTLSNVPLLFDAREVCAQKTADLHGEQVAPTYCGEEGQCGAVVGHWIASKDEPSCQTTWTGPSDKGCQSPGIRHYHTYLENLQNPEYWHEMCMATPGIDLHGVYHPSPNRCDITWNGKHRGIWFVDDSSCK